MGQLLESLDFIDLRTKGDSVGQIHMTRLKYNKWQESFVSKDAVLFLYLLDAVIPLGFCAHWAWIMQKDQEIDSILDEIQKVCFSFAEIDCINPQIIPK